MLSTDSARGYTGERIERNRPLERRPNPFNPLPESVDSMLIKKSNFLETYADSQKEISAAPTG